MQINLLTFNIFIVKKLYKHQRIRKHQTITVESKMLSIYCKFVLFQ